MHGWKGDGTKSLLKLLLPEGISLQNDGVDEDGDVQVVVDVALSDRLDVVVDAVGAGESCGPTAFCRLLKQGLLADSTYYYWYFYMYPLDSRSPQGKASHDGYDCR